MRLNPSVRSQKWLLALTLVFSLFSFSGYAANTQSRTALVQQTEWVASDSQKPGCRIFSLRSATATAFRVNGFSAQPFVLSVFNRLATLQFKTARNALYSFDMRRHLIAGQITVLPSDEEPLSV